MNENMYNKQEESNYQKAEREVKDRLQEQYRFAAQQGAITLQDYADICCCIDKTYEEIFKAGYDFALSTLKNQEV